MSEKRTIGYPTEAGSIGYSGQMPSATMLLRENAQLRERAEQLEAALREILDVKPVHGFLTVFQYQQMYEARIAKMHEIASAALAQPDAAGAGDDAT
jgi:hypothetical protein